MAGLEMPPNENPADWMWGGPDGCFISWTGFAPEINGEWIPEMAIAPCEMDKI